MASSAKIQMNGYKHIWCSHSKFEPHRIMKEVIIKWHKIISTKPATTVPQESIRQEGGEGGWGVVLKLSCVWSTKLQGELKDYGIGTRSVWGAYLCIHISLYLCIHIFLYSCIIISWYSCTIVEERMFNARDKRLVVYLTMERKEKGQGKNRKRDKGCNTQCWQRENDTLYLPKRVE